MNMSPQILLVDDEPRFIDSLESILHHFNYDCCKAHNGQDAVAMLGGRSFDLVLLDVALPDMSGLEIASFIKRSCPETIVVMLTGTRTVETAVEAMKHGAYDFLTKPLNHEQLLRTLEKGIEHGRLKSRLAESEEKSRLLVEAAWEGMALLDEQMVIEANGQFLKMFGYGEKDIEQGLSFDSLVDFTAKVASTAVTRKNGSTARTGIGHCRDGRQFIAEVRTRSITYEGRPVTALAVRDLTDRVQAEKENLELQKKLAEANKLNALGLMAGQVAHDLNNILTGIVSYPDLLLMQMERSDKHYDQILKIQEAGKRAAAVVSDLVAITRGRMQQKTVEDPNDLVRQYLGSLEHRERLSCYADVRVETTLQKNIWNVCCAPQQIYKVLLNLIGNALEAVESDGVVRVTTENCLFRHPLRDTGPQGQESEYIRITVADNGPGIADKDISQIFNPFYSTKIMGKSGTGLGLTVVWNIIQEHDGWIEVTSGEPGAVFEIYLPATHEETCRIDNIEVPVIGAGRGERILIVDDQVEQNEVLESALGRLGYTTYSVTSGEAAIDFMKVEPVDLLLMDMIMGEGLNGRETLEHIFREYPGQKAIVVSGYAKREELEKTRQLGVSLFLEKPVTLARINSAIRETLNGG